VVGWLHQFFRHGDGGNVILNSPLWELRVIFLLRKPGVFGKLLMLPSRLCIAQKKGPPGKVVGFFTFFWGMGDEVLSSFAGITICNDKDPCYKDAWAGCAVLLVISYGFYHGIHHHFSPPGNKSKLEGC